jgi:hypothetical protein
MGECLAVGRTYHAYLYRNKPTITEMHSDPIRPYPGAPEVAVAGLALRDQVDSCLQ